LKRIEADVRIDNAASIRVLVRNGFVQFGHSRRSFEVGGTWYDRLHFECHAAAAAVAAG
jgi:ribosomal-protein-alanine N-acetyltransferase